MLGTPKALGEAIEGEAVSQVKPAGPKNRSGMELVGEVKGTG